MIIYFSALMLGLAGSFHCVGMCGAIALSLPLKSETMWSRIGSGLLYNIGRTITYSVLGLLFGLLGQGFVLAGFQQWVSIVMGAIMVLSVLFPALFRNRFDTQRKIFSYTGKLQVTLSRLFGKRSYSSLFTIGLLNGLLPCGLVYVAIAGAIATGNITQGMLFMTVFGLGTIPMLFALSFVGNLATATLRSKIRRIIPYTVVFLGILFVLRGLGLGIPYISPAEERLHLQPKTQTEQPHDCCRKTEN